MKQRGLSPLISGVLMISFTIMIFLLITNWVKEDIIDDAQSNTDKVNKLFSCGTVDVDVVNVCSDGIVLKLNIDNKGDDVKGVNIKVFDESGEVQLIPYESEIISSPNRILSYSNSLDLNENIVNINKIEIYPLNSKGEICLENKESLDNIDDC